MKNNTDNPTLISHPNGLQFSIAIPYTSIKETDNGYIIYIRHADERQQNTILIETRSNKPDNLNLTKKIKGVLYYYSQEIHEGASGGPEKIIRIWKTTTEAQGIFIEHYNQDESNHFPEDAWNIVESISVKS